MKELNTKQEQLIKVGRVAKKAHSAAAAVIKPGISVMLIEKTVKEVIQGSGMKPAFLGYKGYPTVTCISVNEEIVHGIPNDRILKEGDVVAIDLGVEDNGVIVDTARTHPVGKISQRSALLLRATELALKKGIKQAVIGKKTGDIGATIEKIITSAGFYVIRDLTGHGIGKTLQEPPSIPNFGQPGSGTEIKEGMVLAIEPIISTTDTQITVKSDKWTIVALNNCITAHFEDTILVTKDGPLILT